MKEQHFIEFICKLEGFKIRLKELHWSAPSLSIHRLVDSVSTSLSELEDSVAEEFMSVYSLIKPGTISPILPETTEFLESLIDLRSLVVEVKQSTGSSGIWGGIVSRFDDFISTLNKTIYLAKIEG